MEKVVQNRDTYFIGEDGVYLEIQNTREYTDKDGIKRIVVEIKDKKKICKIMGSAEEECGSSMEIIDFPDIT